MEYWSDGVMKRQGTSEDLSQSSNLSSRFLASRRRLVDRAPLLTAKTADEGGCGVVGFAASIPVSGRHIFEPSIQMHNRGNGKGGGIAAAGLIPEQLGVDESLLRDDYLLQVALLDPTAEKEVEKTFISPFFRIDHHEKIAPTVSHEDFGLEVRPPDIARYFVRVKDNVLSSFAEEHGLTDAPARSIEDEFVYQNSVALNQVFYASIGEKRAFVMSHARDLMIFKIVGYAEQVVRYYGLDDLKAKVWIAHQRYPTKGRVWHPAGAHPFIGMNEALVHNGDFANYFSISEHLRQHNIGSQFLTDTEVSVLLFDLLSRTYGYPLECVIEALAPTMEFDFEQLPAEKKKAYRAIQAMHMHGSPDGPWFFIIARSDPDRARHQLLGITDTAMLRPQVFALQEGDVSIGLVASEKQAIDATLRSLSQEDDRFRLIADRYWNARGGSHTDGGSFIFTVEGTNGSSTLSCADKFGRPIKAPPGEWDVQTEITAPVEADALIRQIRHAADTGNSDELLDMVGRSLRDRRGALGERALPCWNLDVFHWFTHEIAEAAILEPQYFHWAMRTLSLFNDRRYDCGAMKRSVVLQLVRQAIDVLLYSVPLIAEGGPHLARRIDWATRAALRSPKGEEQILIIDAGGFPPEGDECDARLLVHAFGLGWKRFIIHGLKGQRFTGCGLGPQTPDVRIDVYDSSGDYLASGIDGMEIRVHDNAQDQLGQIMKSGRLIVYGDVGQAFMYGAKGGEVYIMGNAAGRPLINAAGRPRVVINGTCLDFLAESFMAGDPHQGGGFVILNGIRFDDTGRVQEQDSPYPGSNLFSLASGGALYVRDPHRKLVEEQLNGGAFAELTNDDWNLILPYLQTNEKHFGISIEKDLLTVAGQLLTPREVYRKVHPVRLSVLARQAVPE